MDANYCEGCGGSLKFEDGFAECKYCGLTYGKRKGRIQHIQPLMGAVYATSQASCLSPFVSWDANNDLYWENS